MYISVTNADGAHYLISCRSSIHISNPLQEILASHSTATRRKLQQNTDLLFTKHWYTSW